MAGYRLSKGGIVNRDKPVGFTFNGRKIIGYQKDTVASALLAAGVVLVGRSFKYHRPRGVVAHGVTEPNALVEIERDPARTDPNNRATTIEISEGLIIKSQNHWPSLECDFGELSNIISPLIPAGFYYKTFKWPRWAWRHLYEPCIRAAAGLGKAPTLADPDYYLHRYEHCDVLVVGGGPAGISAARSASDLNQDVLIIDEQSEFGGSLLHDLTATIDGLSGTIWLTQQIDLLRSRANVKILSRTTAFGYYNDNLVALCERVSHGQGSNDGPRERVWFVRAQKVVLATGAHERPSTFVGNDVPGVMLADSIRCYINRYGVAPGRRIVFNAHEASQYDAAFDARAAGIATVVIDRRPAVSCGPELAKARLAGIEVHTGSAISSANGHACVRSVTVGCTETGRGASVDLEILCDCVGMSDGWSPAVHLFSQSGGEVVYSGDISSFIPGVAKQAVIPVGAARGIFDLDKCILDGVSAFGDRLIHRSPIEGTGRGSDLHSHVPAKARGKSFVDFQNDVTTSDIEAAIAEGFHSVEHLKRYTTLGMATDQGKTSNVRGIQRLAAVLNISPSDAGTTTFRPPYTPVTFGALAGQFQRDKFDPVRMTPMHDWAERNGAIFENVGMWKRPLYFRRSSESMQEAVRRECKAVRTAVGMFDASTLGKIEVVGPDAAEFMNRMYVNSWSKLAVGKCRYGLMLNENGYVIDDGVTAKLADGRFHVTTTTSGAGRVFSAMEEFLQTEWPDLSVFITSITEEWAVISLQGPRSREVLRRIAEGFDISTEAFPHMSVREGQVCGRPARVFRVSFTGELGYEINVPSSFGAEVWGKVARAGEDHGICPYGTEATHVLRAERGFVIVGQETDGTTNPYDLGLESMIGKGKEDFVGARSLSLPAMTGPNRKQLVGLLTQERLEILEEGAQIVSQGDRSDARRSLGHVTSSYWSEACQRSIALALMENGRDRKGEIIRVTHGAQYVKATVTDPVFLDPSGARAQN